MVFRLSTRYILDSKYRHIGGSKEDHKRFIRIMRIVGKAIKENKQVKFWYENNIIKIEITE